MKRVDENYSDPVAKLIREEAGTGATTGRARRVGWYSTWLC